MDEKHPGELDFAKLVKLAKAEQGALNPRDAFFDLLRSGPLLTPEEKERMREKQRRMAEEAASARIATTSSVPIPGNGTAVGPPRGDRATIEVDYCTYCHRIFHTVKDCYAPHPMLNPPCSSNDKQGGTPPKKRKTNAREE